MGRDRVAFYAVDTRDSCYTRGNAKGERVGSTCRQLLPLCVAAEASSVNSDRHHGAFTTYR
jgi:hypothetical protein